jgi:hypothetical protein
MIAVLALTECGDQRTYMAVTMTPVNTAPILFSDQHAGGVPQAQGQAHVSSIVEFAMGSEGDRQRQRGANEGEHASG